MTAYLGMQKEVLFVTTLILHMGNIKWLPDLLKSLKAR